LLTGFDYYPVDDVSAALDMTMERVISAPPQMLRFTSFIPSRPASGKAADSGF